MVPAAGSVKGSPMSVSAAARRKARNSSILRAITADASLTEDATREPRKVSPCRSACGVEEIRARSAKSRDDRKKKRMRRRLVRRALQRNDNGVVRNALRKNSMNVRSHIHEIGGGFIIEDLR